MENNSDEWVFFVQSISVPEDRDGSISAVIQFNPNNQKAREISKEGINCLMNYLNKLGEVDGDQ